MKDHVPQKQYAPAVRTEFVQRGIRLVAGLTDLAALRLVAAFQPLLLELQGRRDALFLRMGLLKQLDITNLPEILIDKAGNKDHTACEKPVCMAIS